MLPHVLPSRNRRAFWPYLINKSALFGPGRSLSWTPSAIPLSDKKGTFALWVRVIKHGTTGGQEIRLWDGQYDTNNRAGFKYLTTGELEVFKLISGTASLSDTYNVYRDSSGWQHVVIQIDTTQATAANRYKLWVNGAAVLVHGDDFPLNQAFHLMAQNQVQTICNGAITQSAWRLADYHYIDGQAVAPTEFGTFIGNTWCPKKYTGTYAGNSFHLDFQDWTQPGKDVSGLGNHWTASGDMSLTLDSPTNTAPLLNGRMGTTGIAFDWGGTRITNTVGGVGWKSAVATVAYPQTGKWYYEVRGDAANEDLHVLAGGTRDWPDLDTYFTINPSFGCQGNGNISGQYITPWGDDPSKILGVLYDADAGEASFYLNGVKSGPTVSYPANGKDVFPAFGVSWSTTNASGAKLSVNFGHVGWTYPAPAGALGLCSANMPYPEANNGRSGIQPHHYTGNGTDNRQLTTAQFDTSKGAIVLGKQTSGTQNWFAFDTVRGATKYLAPNLTDAEVTSTGGVQAFLQNGIQIGTSSYINQNATTIVTWMMRIGARYGIDAVSYTGNGVATLMIDHSLGAAPEVIILKSRTVTGTNWLVGHKDMADASPWNYGLKLNTNEGAVASQTFFNNTAPTATQFPAGSSVSGNTNGATQIAYLFRSIPGFSKAGYYLGNGSDDGPYIHLGFRPAFILLKRVDATGDWLIYDSWRVGANARNYPVYPNLNNAQGATCGVDFDATGFKVITSSTGHNSASGPGRYVYLAFAEAPGKYANAR